MLIKRGAGPSSKRQQGAEMHICGTVVCSMDVFLYIKMEQTTSNEVA
jgi:hypothetical protein